MALFARISDIVHGSRVATVSVFPDRGLFTRAIEVVRTALFRSPGLFPTITYRPQPLKKGGLRLLARIE
jgi:hypothetical protein